jgi:mRNA-degrading endonuclease RelE of RelBE toxin-antitoxin system
MPDETKKMTVQFTPEFKRNLRTLAKKYRHIRNDIEPVIA